MQQQYCGYVSIIGRPNVGKSTLLNHLLGQKISITSRKPQTTRHRLLGIKTEKEGQIIYVDTPGLHQNQHNAMNRYLNRAALSSIEGMNVILWVLEALKWTDEDAYILNIIEKINIPIIVVINKVDKITAKNELLPYLQEISKKYHFTDIIPASALQGHNLVAIENKIKQFLPISPLLFPEEYITDRSERFLCAELIREKLINRLGAELPYRITVQIEYFKTEEKLIHISAIIWVERSSQKAIVIGKQGRNLKEAGKAAREEMEVLLENKVFLQLWVKVKQGWSDDERALQQLGYGDIDV